MFPGRFCVVRLIILRVCVHLKAIILLVLWWDYSAQVRHSIYLSRLLLCFPFRRAPTDTCISSPKEKLIFSDSLSVDNREYICRRRRWHVEMFAEDFLNWFLVRVQETEYLTKYFGHDIICTNRRHEMKHLISYEESFFFPFRNIDSVFSWRIYHELKVKVRRISTIISFNYQIKLSPWNRIGCGEDNCL